VKEKLPFEVILRASWTISRYWVRILHGGFDVGAFAVIVPGDQLDHIQVGIQGGLQSKAQGLAVLGVETGVAGADIGFFINIIEAGESATHPVTPQGRFTVDIGQVALQDIEGQHVALAAAIGGQGKIAVEAPFTGLSSVINSGLGSVTEKSAFQSSPFLKILRAKDEQQRLSLDLEIGVIAEPGVLQIAHRLLSGSDGILLLDLTLSIRCWMVWSS